jgi:hypothetical protein
LRKEERAINIGFENRPPIALRHLFARPTDLSTHTAACMIKPIDLA